MLAIIADNFTRATAKVAVIGSAICDSIAVITVCIYRLLILLPWKSVAHGRNVFFVFSARKCKKAVFVSYNLSSDPEFLPLVENRLFEEISAHPDRF